MPDSEMRARRQRQPRDPQLAGRRGGMAPATATPLAYEAVHPWITGMAVAQWQTGTPTRTTDPTLEESPT